MYNPFKAHVVQFRDGKYGIRRHVLLWWVYKDFHTNDYWWKANSRWINDCKTPIRPTLPIPTLTDKGTRCI